MRGLTRERLPDTTDENGTLKEATTYGDNYEPKGQPIMTLRHDANTKPKLLDLFCGAGGAGMGYARAGFEVVGVDLHPQPHYPFKFIQADALDYVAQYGWMYDAIHASPPCQVHSTITPDKSKHVDFIPQTRFWLQSIGVPYVIENVYGAHKSLKNPVMLCGADFGLKVYRHRLFESNILLMTFPHQPHRDNMGRSNGLQGMSDKGFVLIAGHFAGVEYGRYAMGIDWMTAKELSQAIPPAYTEYIGRQLLRAVESRLSEVAA